jgi:hypothetical protein
VGHAHHFLERLDRVSRAQTEFALKLYRDEEAVNYVLDRVNMPLGTERVALAIDDPQKGPFVIVTRDGHFVTCLGAGMKHEHPVVPRPQIDALLAKVAEMRARKEFVQRELRPDEEEGTIFQRFVTRGNRFAREDFVALSAFESLLGVAPYMIMLDMTIETVKLRPAMMYGAHRVVVKTSTIKALEKLDRFEWSIAHLMLLACTGERRNLDEVVALGRRELSPTFACSVQEGTTFFLRAAWAAARLGKAVIPLYKKALVEQTDWRALVDAGLGLGAIALRHASTMSEVKRALAAWEAPSESDPPTAERTRRAVASAVLENVEDADARIETMMKLGRDFCVVASGHLPEGHPLRFTKPEDVPDDLARTAVLSFDGDVHNPTVRNLVFMALPLAARASGEDFYFPREIVRAWKGPWDPEETLARLKRAASAAPKEAPARVEPRPGRNDPCPCGSGKKYKKCHGGPGQVATG